MLKVLIHILKIRIRIGSVVRRIIRTTFTASLRRPRLATIPQRASSSRALRPSLFLAASLTLVAGLHLQPAAQCPSPPKDRHSRRLGAPPRCSAPPISLFSSLQPRILVAGTPSHFPESKRPGRARECRRPPFARSSPATSIHQLIFWLENQVDGGE